jgi:hypothetical protein
MAISRELPGCCGVQVVYGLAVDNDEYSSFFEEALSVVRRKNRAKKLIVFADNVSEKVGGTRIATIIKKEKLGELVASPQATNPVHRNQSTVQVWVWKPVKARLAVYCKKHPVRVRELFL